MTTQGFIVISNGEGGCSARALADLLKGRDPLERKAVGKDDGAKRPTNNSTKFGELTSSDWVR